jgi:hypothetical protein
MSRNGISWKSSPIGGLVLVLLAVLALAACGEGGTGGGDATSAATQAEETTTAADTTDETTTEEEPEEEPITAAEERWAKQVTRYIRRADRVIFTGGVVTEASVRSEIAVLEECRPTLRRAGDPGRFAPAERRVRRACDRFERAAGALHRVLDAGGPTAVVGTPEEKIISAGMDVSTEAEGNGYNTLTRARDQIAAIRARLPK